MQGVQNTITALLQPSATIPAGSILIMTGLTYSLTQSGTVNITSTNFATAAVWNQVSGTLQVTITAALAQQSAYNFSFNLQNPYFYQASPAISVSVTGPLPMSMFAILKPSNNSHAMPLNIQGIVFSKMCQSTPSVQSMNIITVTFSTFLDFTFGAVQNSTARDSFTLLGLIGSASRDAVLSVTTSAIMLPTTGSWTQDPGTFALTLSATLRAMTNISFSFQILNPPAAQSAPNTSLQIPGCLHPFLKSCGVNYNALMVAGFSNVYAFQSNSFPSQSNTITVQITATVNVMIGSLITISGFAGSPQASNENLPLIGGSNGSFFASTSGATGSITWALPPKAGLNLGQCCNVVFTVAQPLIASVMYTLAFVLTNPTFPQSAPILSIASTVGTLMQSTAVSLGPDKAAPLFVPGFTFVEVGQSSPFEGYSNSISVTFAASCVFEVSTVVVVQLNSLWQPVSSVLPLLDRGNFVQVFGNSGSWNANTMALSLTVGKATQTNVLYAFSFAITNGAASQSAPSISISASGATLSILSVPMNQASSYDAAFYTVPVSVDSTKVCSSTVSWSKVAAAQWEGRRGLGFIAKGGLTLIDSSVPPFALEAIWMQPSVSLTFYTSAVFLAGIEYVARVHMKNPSTAQNSPPTYIETSSFGIFKESLDTNATGVLNFTGSRSGDQAVLKTYDPGQFHTVRIGQSSPFPYAQNTLTITIISSSTLQDVGGGAQVVVTGLTGTLQPDSASLSLSFQGSGATVFQNTGQWTQGTGSLILNFLTGAALPPGDAAIVSFVLTNNVGVPSPQGPQTVFVSFSGNIVISATVADTDSTTILPFLGSVAGDTEPLVVYPPKVTFASSGQSTPLQSANNTITVTIVANFALTTSTRITISSILGTFSAFSPSTAASATWSAGTKAITVVPTQPLTAGSLLLVQFTVINPAAAQSSSPLNLQLSDTSLSISLSAQIQSAAGNAAPFYVYSTGYLLTLITQSIPYPTAANRLSAMVQFTANLVIPAQGGQLVLEGLTGCSACS